jgi:hypothetical protein
MRGSILHVARQPLAMQCAQGYSGCIGVSAIGCQVGSRSVAGLSSMSPLRMIPAPYVRLAEPDLALLYLGFLFETLHDAPERDDAMLGALAGQIIDERPKTLLGLAIKALVAKWFCRHLWMADFDSLSPCDQAARVVIDSAMRVADGEGRSTATSHPDLRVLKEAAVPEGRAHQAIGIDAIPRS